jgi:hypothetical protein
MGWVEFCLVSPRRKGLGWACGLWWRREKGSERRRRPVLSSSQSSSHSLVHSLKDHAKYIADSTRLPNESPHPLSLRSGLGEYDMVTQYQSPHPRVATYMRTFVLPRIAEPQYVPQQRVACRERVSERASGRTGEQASMSQDKTRQDSPGRRPRCATYVAKQHGCAWYLPCDVETLTTT